MAAGSLYPTDTLGLNTSNKFNWSFKLRDLQGVREAHNAPFSETEGATEKDDTPSVFSIVDFERRQRILVIFSAEVDEYTRTCKRPV